MTPYLQMILLEAYAAGHDLKCLPSKVVRPDCARHNLERQRDYIYQEARSGPICSSSYLHRQLRAILSVLQAIPSSFQISALG